MIAEFLDKDVVQSYVSAVRDRVAAGDLDASASAAAHTIGRGDADPAQAMLATIPESAGPPSSGESLVKQPFLSRDPAVSLLQTSLEDELRKQDDTVRAGERHGLFAHIVGVFESILHPERFGPHDPDWVTRVGEATLDRLAKGNHPFNPTPAEYEIADDHARVVIVGDWGSGLSRAKTVAQHMGAAVEQATAAGRQAHVIHLGDVYYSGDPVEYRRRVIADGMWPVTVAQARAGVTSWSLNGNHDMYSGGYGYFDTLLRGDERFAAQRSPDGEGTSFFRLRTPSWDIAGLDTSWDSEVLSLGQTGVLHDPQTAILTKWAAESDNPLMLLSHHQLVSSYDLSDLGTTLPFKLRDLLGAKRIKAWLWGHEHRCMAFEDVRGVEYMRCIGHGGIPVPAVEDEKPIPAPGTWQLTGCFEENGTQWNRFGFAVLDFDGPRVDVSYRDDAGAETRTESFN
jgi:hypothetical protein